MKITQSGFTFQIYDDGLVVRNQLPPACYEVFFDKMKGWFLKQTDEIEIKEKVYGIHQDKVNKVMQSFKRFNRNLGVILSGDKGIGKSLFSKMLAKEAIEQGFPLIIVNSYIPGIASFLTSIQQEVVVLFDEFDKTFPSGEGTSSQSPNDSQAEMLTLFDGIAQGKKLFVVTCNSLRNINSYLVNRPGRFHYHFRFDYPKDHEIREYMEDKIPKDKYDEINKVIGFSKKTALNYDCLRAIAFELNYCDTFEEAISDLNIIRTFGDTYDIVLILDNGERFKENGLYIDLWDDESHSLDIETHEAPYFTLFNIQYTPSLIRYDVKLGRNVIDAKDFNSFRVSGQLTTEYDDTDIEDARMKFYEKYKDAKPERLEFRRRVGKNIHYEAF